MSAEGHVVKVLILQERLFPWCLKQMNAEVYFRSSSHCFAGVMMMAMVKLKQNVPAGSVGGLFS